MGEAVLGTLSPTDLADVFLEFPRPLPNTLSALAALSVVRPPVNFDYDDSDSEEDAPSIISVSDSSSTAGTLYDSGEDVVFTGSRAAQFYVDLEALECQDNEYIGQFGPIAWRFMRETLLLGAGLDLMISN